jgi:hypothetical protein
MFCWIVPLNKNGVCGMIERFFLRLCSPIWSASAPPTNSCEPGSATNVLNKAWIMLDLPAPVRPTIPTFCPPSILNVIPWSTGFNLSLYLIVKFRNSILAFAGQTLAFSGGTITPCYSLSISSLKPIDLSYSVLSGASGSRFARASPLSTLTMILSVFMICLRNH